VRTFVTALLALLALAAGTVLVGMIGDQGAGFDVVPFLGGALAAVVVVLARVRWHHRGAA